jgi:hypothetical protein
MADNLTIYYTSTYVDCLEIWQPQAPGTLSPPGLYRVGLPTYTHTHIHTHTHIYIYIYIQ